MKSFVYFIPEVIPLEHGSHQCKISSEKMVHLVKIRKELKKEKEGVRKGLLWDLKLVYLSMRTAR